MSVQGVGWVVNVHTRSRRVRVTGCDSVSNENVTWLCCCQNKKSGWIPGSY